MHVHDGAPERRQNGWMPSFTVRTVNSMFVTETELDGIETTEKALAVAVRGALAMLSDDINQGSCSQSATVTVSVNGQPVSAVAVSLSVAPLFVGEATA